MSVVEHMTRALQAIKRQATHYMDTQRSIPVLGLVDILYIVDKAMEQKADAVHSPSHYTAGGIETIEFIRAKLTPEQLKGYYLGNLLKYLSRGQYKNGLEDYQKSQVYLKWLLELEDQEASKKSAPNTDDSQ